MAIKKRKGVSPKEGESKYGNVNYADETNKKYPLDTKAHVRAAASYWGMPKNRAKYSSEDQKKITGKIRAAEKKFAIGEHSVPIPEIEIFRAGTHESKSGQVITYTEKDLDEMRDSFSADQPPHFIVGHSSDYTGTTLIPSYGMIKGGLKRVGDKLYAVGSEFTNKLAEWVKEGFYGERSCEIGRVDGKLKLFAVAMLGAHPPSVPGMEPITQDVIMEGAEYSSPSVALEFAAPVDEGIDWEGLEDRAIEKTLEEIQGEFEDCMQNLTQELAQTGADDDDDEEYMAQTRANCFQHLYSCYDSVTEELRLHFALQDGINELEAEDESKLSEMAKKIKGLVIHYFSKGKSLINNNSKEGSDMDQKEKDGYETQIADLKKQNEELASARTASETKVQEFADKALREEIHAFCVAEKLDTNKHKEMKVEEMLFAAAKSSEAIEFASKGEDGKDKTEKRPLLTVLKEFAKTIQVSQPKPGELAAFSQAQDLPHESTENAKIANARQYIKDHPAEFAKMTPEVALRNALIKQS